MDICGSELGKDWKLPTQADLESISDADYAFVQQTLTAAGAGGVYFTPLGLGFRRRREDAKGDMTPGVCPRVTPLGIPDSMLVHHYESELGLRCLKFHDF